MGSVRARWWKALGERQVVCGLCPRACRLAPGERGFCFLRHNRDGELLTDGYGAVTSLAVDPVEKKPLYHVLPGSSVLSFGLLGCNLDCAFCQNYSISRATSTRLMRSASVEEIVCAAQAHNCSGIAYTYNEPIISGEFLVDVADKAREAGLRNLMVSNGYVTPAAARDLFSRIDALNVDLKAFREEFYRRFCDARLKPVLDTLCQLHEESDVWIELTHLVIPGENDDPDDMRRLAAWVAEKLDPATPLHLTAFFPTHRMQQYLPTPPETIQRLVDVARQEGLYFVYPGNLAESRDGDTHCPFCKALLLERSRMGLRHCYLIEDACPGCGERIPGVWS